MATQKLGFVFFLLLCFVLGEAKAEKAEGWELYVGIYNHGLETFDSKNREGGLDFNFEVRAPALLTDKWGNEYFRWNLGSSISVINKTHIFHTGFAFDFFEPIAPFFVSLSLGMAVHTGRRGANTAGFNALGCRWAFHENLSLGVVFKTHHKIMLSVEHISNASGVLSGCPHNAGLSNIGGRYSYRF